MVSGDNIISTQQGAIKFNQNGKTCVSASVLCDKGSIENLDVSEINQDFKQVEDGGTVSVSGCESNPNHCDTIGTCEKDTDCFDIGGNKMVCGSINTAISFPSYSPEWAEVTCDLDQNMCGSIMFCDN